MQESVFVFIPPHFRVAVRVDGACRFKIETKVRGVVASRFAERALESVSRRGRAAAGRDHGARGGLRSGRGVYGVYDWQGQRDVGASQSGCAAGWRCECQAR